MKKIISVILMISILSPLMAQNNYTFPEYMERLQRQVPKKAIQWFEENGYSDAYGVDKRIFIFYRGIRRNLYAICRQNFIFWYNRHRIAN